MLQLRQITSMGLRDYITWPSDRTHQTSGWKQLVALRTEVLLGFPKREPGACLWLIPLPLHLYMPLKDRY